MNRLETTAVPEDAAPIPARGRRVARKTLRDTRLRDLHMQAA